MTDLFDVFLCHNSEDKPAVKEIGSQLRKKGLRPWLDEWELRPGMPWQPLLEEHIGKINAVAVFLGPSGMGPWQEVELDTFLREFIRRKCPVIPVILPGVSKLPELPVYLSDMVWVDFRQDEPDPLERLIWGITGERHRSRVTPIQKTSEPKVVAIASGKGGTGKSIIAASIAYILAHCGFKTLLVDMDLFTHGLTFYALAEYPRRVKVSAEDIFLSGNDELKLIPVEIPHPFVQGNLHFIPSITGGRKSKAELNLTKKYSDIAAFRLKFQSMLNKVVSEYNSDYIIVDTRGGTDHTSVGLSITASGFIVVTEADKPSWDMGRVLVDTIEAIAAREGVKTSRLGFIINKNVLPPESTESFLRKEWQMPHLATIPLDENAVTFFQEDKVPVSEDIGCPFSHKVLGVVRKLFYSESWAAENRKQFEKLESLAVSRANKIHIAERFSFIMRIYGTVLSTGLLLYLGFSIVRETSDPTVPLWIVIITVMLIFAMTASEPHFLRQIIDRNSKRRKV